MKKSKEIRAEARKKLLGNYGTVIGAYIIYTVVLNMLSAPFGLISGLDSFLSFPLTGAVLSIPFSILLSFISLFFALGVNKISFDIAHDRNGVLSDIFFCFTHNPLTVISACLWIFLCMLPAVILFSFGTGAYIFFTVFSSSENSAVTGIYILAVVSVIYLIWITWIGLGASMTFFMYYEDQSIRARDLVSTSFKMMKGHKKQLFLLYLSYFGYYVLSLLSCGLALLWLNPNITVATALFYEELKKGGSPDSRAENLNYENPVQEKPDYKSPEYHQDYWN